MTKHTMYAGSTGTENAYVIQQLFYKFKNEFEPYRQTSANWQTYWNARATLVGQPRPLQYRVGSHLRRTPVDTPAGWYQYYRDLLLSTHNTSSGASHVLGLPDQTWRAWSTLLPTLTTLGSTDADIGRRVFDIWNTTSVNVGGETIREPFRDSEGFELLCAFGGRGIGSSNLGSSAQL